MRISQLTLAVLVVAVSLSVARPVHAQYRSRRYPTYRPSRPTMSPWLDLFRHDTGVLPNYHTFVRPKQQLQQTLSRQNFELGRQRTQLRALEENVSTFQERGSMRPTGIGGGFMNYSHFYSSPAHSAPARSAPASQARRR